MSKNRVILILVGIGILTLAGLAGWYFFSPLFINQIVDESLPLELSNLTPIPTEGAEAITTEIFATAAAMPDKEMDDAMPGGEDAVVLRKGTFRDADKFHQGSGIATIYDLPDGSRFLRFELFEVTNGPDLHVYLASGTAPTGREDLGEFIDLGELKGNIGNQNYEISGGITLESFNSVVIYCVPFHVIFSYAPLIQ
jgi:hypothetical protein